MSPLEVRRELVQRPVFSICIPQHNRTSFLIEACKSLQSQTFTDFEICISDDCSTDGREAELLAFLDGSGCSFVYRCQLSNLRYDANLRASIALARGEYVFLLGNDDCLARPTTLAEIAAHLRAAGPVGVAVTNYAGFADDQPVSRVTRTGIVGSGPSVAARSFRNFSFVSGVILEAAGAQRHATARWDGAEMYQMFLATRLVAAGGTLLYIDTVAIRKDIQVPGEAVDSIVARPRLDPCPIVERHLPLGQISRLVADAIAPYTPRGLRARLCEQVARQLYVFTYPFWIIKYRELQSWRFALGVCLGLRPDHSLAGLELSPAARLRLSILFWLSSAAALAVPRRLIDRLSGSLYRAAKATT